MGHQCNDFCNIEAPICGRTVPNSAEGSSLLPLPYLGISRFFGAAATPTQRHIRRFLAIKWHLKRRMHSTNSLRQYKVMTSVLACSVPQTHTALKTSSGAQVRRRLVAAAGSARALDSSPSFWLVLFICLLPILMRVILRLQHGAMRCQTERCIGPRYSSASVCRSGLLWCAEVV